MLHAYIKKACYLSEIHIQLGLHFWTTMQTFEEYVFLSIPVFMLEC